ncbi:MAG: cell envelope integrity protein TolA [Pseudomonadota bacterium]
MKLTLMQTRLLPFLYSFIMHLLLVLLLVGSIDFESLKPEEKPSAPIIQAKAIDQVKIDETREKIRQRQQAQEDLRQKKQADAQKKLQEMERKRKLEEAKAKQAQEKRLKEEKERKIVEEKKRKAEAEQKLAEQKRQEAEALRQKELEAAAEAEKKRKAEEKRIADAKAKREKEEKERRQREEEARRKAEAERLLAEELALEQEQAAAAREQAVLSEVERYRLLIKDKITQNFNTSGVISECVLTVRIGPGGMVVSVKDIQGDPITCERAESAVFKSQPLPVPTDSDVFNRLREIRYRFDFASTSL